MLRGQRGSVRSRGVLLTDFGDYWTVVMCVRRAVTCVRRAAAA
ncbi:hypothetical protein F7D09_1876 [Bifidobacterium leontopitheci]|uniref:Uncharacterized protein n=1 Tax=Bifidobacterium leontopitheci TaxID=2650774 RepID=A0A6I1GT19_9BIFI|nr:hypothetical protein F7D09_1876 [Bifidobacterium leontopitheci]